MSGEFQSGEHLPSERALAEQLGVGRTSVREALRMLQTEGLVSIERGRNGGIRVAEPGPQHLGQFVEGFISGAQTDVSAILEAREVIEPQCAYFAALRREDDDLEELRSAADELKAAERDEKRFTKANFRWHVAIARASKNELLVAFILGISGPLRQATETGVASARKTRREVISIHDAIMAAVEEQDGEAARRRMMRHIDAYVQQMSRVRSTKAT